MKHKKIWYVCMQCNVCTFIFAADLQNIYLNRQVIYNCEKQIWKLERCTL